MTTATRNEVRRATTALSKLYGERLVKGSKKDTSFQYTSKGGDTITARLRPADEVGILVTLEWEDGAAEIHKLDELTLDLQKAPAVEAIREKQTRDKAEKEANAKADAKAKKRTRKSKKTTEPKAKKAKKPRKPRAAALGQGGHEPTDAEHKKIVKQITAAHEDHPFKRNGLIYLLITEHDLNNESIVEIFEDYFEELLPCDNAAVAKVRRAILRKQKQS